MALFNNPVLQRELLVNLRMGRSFLLLLLYQALLGTVVYFAWPRPAGGQSGDVVADMTTDAQSSENNRRLANLFFQGQFLIASLMSPSFAAGSITGEKERATYEMLLASPLHPTSIVWGKLVAALTHLAILIFASLPIIMLCLPLGGISFGEVVANYGVLIGAVAMFGSISVACSAYFQRTSASLVVSYLLILPLALIALFLWQLEMDGQLRLTLSLFVAPPLAYVVCLGLFAATSARLLHPPDVGSEGKDVVDLERESQTAVGLVIRSDQWPDKLFAPEKRTTLLEDGANPVYDKEMRSEIFSQGTLMLRIVIQVSMLVAIPLMALCLYIFPERTPWYIAYVITFNVLVGPVFSAGSVTSERERETLDLLLTTTISPWQILWGKLISGLRVSSVLTSFLLWPLLLALVMVYCVPGGPRQDIPGVFAFIAIVAMTCLTTAVMALFCSVLFRKTATSLMTTYALIAGLFFLPAAAIQFSETFFKEHAGTVRAAGFPSPLVAAFSVPFQLDKIKPAEEATRPKPTWIPFSAYLWTTAWGLALMFGLMIWLFNTRWRVAGDGGSG